MSKMVHTDEKIQFKRLLNAIMWISTEGLPIKEEAKIIDIINRKINADDIKFYGFCFGRFDLIFEFRAESARLASNVVCDLQDEISENHPACSSLSLCSEITKVGEENEGESNGSVRTYTFLTPKGRDLQLIDALNVIQELDSDDDSSEMRLLWNASAYSFLLIVTGDSFNDIFIKIEKFREKTEHTFSESFTYIGLAWEGDEKVHEKEIKALTFIKLRSGHGDLELTKEDRASGWNPKNMDKRLGWSDISFEISGDKLRDIKEAILKLRQNHCERKDIVGTSTLILPQV